MSSGEWEPSKGRGRLEEADMRLQRGRGVQGLRLVPPANSAARTEGPFDWRGVGRGLQRTLKLVQDPAPPPLVRVGRTIVMIKRRSQLMRGARRASGLLPSQMKRSRPYRACRLYLACRSRSGLAGAFLTTCDDR